MAVEKAMAEPATQKRPSAAPAEADGIWSSLAGTLLARYPGPVVVADRRGRTLGANEAGRSVAELLETGGSGALDALVANAVESDEVQSGGIILGEGEKAARLNLTVMPFGGNDGISEGVVIVGTDVTLQENLRHVLVESRSRYKDLVECSTDFVWETDAEGCFVFVSTRGALGLPAAELIGRSARSFQPEDADGDAVWPFEAQESLERVEISLARADGERITLIVSCIPLTTEAGEWLGARGVCRDVTEERRRDAALARAQARERLLSDIVRTLRDEVEPQTLLRTAARATAEGLGTPYCWIYRVHDDKTIACTAEHVAGRDSVDSGDIHEIVRQSLSNEASPPARVAGLAIKVCPTRYQESINGAICVARERSAGVYNEDDESLLAGIAEQLGIAIEQIASQEALLKLSRTDSLTGLLNRRAFAEQIELHMANACRREQGAALIFIDLNNFKAVNDNLGHKQGDAALQMLASLLREHTRLNDPVARLGGDEFAVWFNKMTISEIELRAATLAGLHKKLTRFSGDPDRPLGLSVGVAMFDPDDPETLDEMLVRADHAMYEIKKQRKSGYAMSQSGAGSQNEGQGGG
jgi:diguanylate cyclase (GGDEF)-like protein/PAS domain S-box-containing protein